ncbi:bifunctional adenosylcobinamide kinase/adenosylcobinamide-phosphate guanylyltransferase [Photobacterium sp. DNB23_23_1]|uniref:Bifunctional adenosylcobalamin biosynthesis protein n=1 Tax=Photobacterium pectinilyticum TaxID=2906793 RepID=A0ABT1N7U6_9GAMM|nr:bifunctional adenosylcobinamide kinase/adenosylcobinamide-phosphate guanylyltransferase [Photobacterium sp. ZSDE20]MCQ1060818.1 bifunctional adenosylcobinamide kinase/adenosylcobinamide-phosphate guanylyltransferase [Photobacterium sp. ZSDE20]MDD1828559.1 bifunctional adenosylcobinamide kinase/adenosylcobinamide-phosphate guanylyltransferase [Photobacterium sp. ZSDE20]
MATELVLGGARSGKSRYAESIAQINGKPVIYIATATAGDEEMAERIERHRQDRPYEWTVVEEPTALALAITELSTPGNCLLVDCLTLWLTNCLFNKDFSTDWRQQKAELLGVLEKVEGDVILVSNEVGQGIVPMGEMSRRFVDESGWLHQAIAAQVDRVTFVTAGIPQLLKGA